MYGIEMIADEDDAFVPAVTAAIGASLTEGRR